MAGAPLHILLIGCGKMGGAMLQSWVKDQAITAISIVDPSHLRYSSDKITHITNITDLPNDTNYGLAILAVKPQMMAEVCNQLKSKITGTTPILSIAAGKTIASFEAIFGANHPIIRTMPNTPAAIGKGITALCPNASVTKEQIALATKLLQATGQVEQISDESLFDAITALSGSGPAYIFHLIETLETAGAKAGLPSDLASKLARQTVIGAASLAEAEAGTPASTLRQNVTSPGGTTAAALKILMNGELQEIYNKALEVARDRGIELNKS